MQAKQGAIRAFWLAAGLFLTGLGIIGLALPVMPGTIAALPDDVAVDAAFGGRIDIVIDTTLHIRPGGLLDRATTVGAREEMERVYFGPLRLAQALGPVLRARAGEGSHAACAWVSLLSIAGLVPQPGYRLNAAAHAAALSLVHTLRAELRPLKIIAALVGPLDDDWHQTLPPPKVTPGQLAAAVLRGLTAGLEDLTVGDIARDVLDRWTDHPAITLRQP